MRWGDAGWLGRFADLVEDLLHAAGIDDEGDDPHGSVANRATQWQGFIDARRQHQNHAGCGEWSVTRLYLRDNSRVIVGLSRSSPSQVGRTPMHAEKYNECIDVVKRV